MGKPLAPYECVYGPTECAVMSSPSSRIGKPSQAINIGYCLWANLWLTDIGNPSRLAPTGTIGEILIEGLVGLRYMGRNPETYNPLSFTRHGFLRVFMASLGEIVSYLGQAIKRDTMKIAR
ncbi:hypothetical protein HDV63DRAFT_378753 [Trichoderma sp. SZMC 28014]